MASYLPIRRPTPHVVIQREQRAARAQEHKAVRTAVWQRDGGRCRACGRRARHLHHIRYRSHGGQTTPANCLLLCHRCHQDVHARILRIVGTDANDREGLQFEREAWW
jgi:5-methylcytosine-specific restriction endonuclease McrA